MQVLDIPEHIDPPFGVESHSEKLINRNRQSVNTADTDPPSIFKNVWSNFFV